MTHSFMLGVMTTANVESAAVILWVLLEAERTPDGLRWNVIVLWLWIEVAIQGVAWILAWAFS